MAAAVIISVPISVAFMAAAAIISVSISVAFMATAVIISFASDSIITASVTQSECIAVIVFFAAVESLSAFFQVITRNIDGFGVGSEESLSGYLHIGNGFCNQAAFDSQPAKAGGFFLADNRIQEICFCSKGKVDNRGNAACCTRQAKLSDCKGGFTRNVNADMILCCQTQSETLADTAAEDAAAQNNRQFCLKTADA